MTLIQKYINRVVNLKSYDIENQSQDSEFQCSIKFDLNDSTLEVLVTGTQTTEEVADDEYSEVVTDYTISQINIFSSNGKLLKTLPLDSLAFEEEIHNIMNREFDVHLENVDYGTDQYHKWGYNFVA